MVSVGTAEMSVLSVSVRLGSTAEGTESSAEAVVWADGTTAGAASSLELPLKSDEGVQAHSKMKASTKTSVPVL
jgi:hypothetical protein